MTLRSLAVWVLLLVLAILNGGVRESWIIPRWGIKAGHVVSTLMLTALILAAVWLMVRWLGPTSSGAALRIGLLLLALTFAFEFLAGHFLFRRSWSSLWAEYDLSQGRIWILVPVVTLLAPLLAGRLRGLFH